VHSYHAVPDDKNIIAATTIYGEKVTAAIEFENIFATQFHPEKSGDVGLQVLKNFVMT
jgi:glutamine amidotransferase